jgi:hypothetical protein
MDNSYYEELAGRLYGLVIRLGDRLPAGQARWLHHVIDAGEYGLALEDFRCGRFREQRAISGSLPAERGQHCCSAGRAGTIDGGWRAVFLARGAVVDMRVPACQAK